MLGSWRSIVVLLVASVALGCTSPESTRTRGDNAGVNVGNHPRAVQFHAGNKIYYGTRRYGGGIGKRALIEGLPKPGSST
jgi:hypothetical protein